MSRKRTTDQQQSHEQPKPESTAAAAEPTSPADPPAPANDNVQAANDNQPGFADKVGQRKFAAGPDPFGIASDNLAGVRLFESKRDRQMAIKFDEKPPQAVIDKVKEAGYRWNQDDMIWAHPVRSESAMRTRIDAERLYQEVRMMIREAKGIETGQEVPF